MEIRDTVRRMVKRKKNDDAETRHLDADAPSRKAGAAHTQRAVNLWGPAFASQVASSPFFCMEFVRSLGIEGDDVQELAGAFMEACKSSRTISAYPYFDADFYLKTYRDVDSAGCNAYLHFLAYGAMEGRYPSKRALAADYAEIVSAKHLDRIEGWQEFRESATVVRSCLLKWAEPPELKDVDYDFIHKYYFESLKSVRHITVAIARWSMKWWFHLNEESARQHADIVRASKLFSASFYARNYHDRMPAEADPALYYFCEGWRRKMAPEKFSDGAYLAGNPDIFKGEMPPLLHFELAGRAEERHSFAGSDAASIVDNLQVPEDKPVVLICCHEASLSGAPAVGIELCRWLRRDYAVIVLLMRGGALEQSFRALADAVIMAPVDAASLAVMVGAIKATFSPRFAIVNSAAFFDLSEQLSSIGVPVVSLIHEFASYMPYLGNIARRVIYSDASVFPARVVFESAQADAAKRGIELSARDVHFFHQGRPLMPDLERGTRETKDIFRHVLEERGIDVDGLKIVVGAGSVQPRKGVDMFIDVAARVTAGHSGKAIFVWIGGGYDPDRDKFFSSYLEDQVTSHDLDGKLFFIGELMGLDSVWPECDLFFLSSTLDPFPNVAIDALCEQVPVVCFDRATGFAEMAVKTPLVKVVAYRDTTKAAETISETLFGPGAQPRGTRLKAATRDHDGLFSNEAYARRIADLGEAAALHRAKTGETSRAPLTVQRPMADHVVLRWLFEKVVFATDKAALIAMLQSIGHETLAYGIHLESDRFLTVPAKTKSGASEIICRRLPVERQPGVRKRLDGVMLLDFLVERDCREQIAELFWRRFGIHYVSIGMLRSAPGTPEREAAIAALRYAAPSEGGEIGDPLAAFADSGSGLIVMSLDRYDTLESIVEAGEVLLEGMLKYHELLKATGYVLVDGSPHLPQSREAPWHDGPSKIARALACHFLVSPLQLQQVAASGPGGGIAGLLRSGRTGFVRQLAHSLASGEGRLLGLYDMPIGTNRHTMDYPFGC
ncbi:MAG: glycosyltransferase family 4 protein [Hyphomicrobiales bacterium]